VAEKSEWVQWSKSQNRDNEGIGRSWNINKGRKRKEVITTNWASEWNNQLKGLLNSRRSNADQVNKWDGG